MNEKQVLVALILVFVSVQVIGLLVAHQYMGYYQIGEVKLAFENPNDIGNSFYLFGCILLMTLILLIVIKLRKRFITVFEILAVFVGSDIVFEMLLPMQIAGWGALLAALLTFWKIKWPSIKSQNVALVFALAGAGAILGVSIAPLPLIIFMLILSIYDFLSVFWTKHMVYMAKAMTEKPTAFTAAFPMKTKKVTHTFQLGGGDLVVPLMFASSLLFYFGLQQAVFALAGGLAALVLLFWHVLTHPGRALPALPPISCGLVLGFAVSLLI